MALREELLLRGKVEDFSSAIFLGLQIGAGVRGKGERGERKGRGEGEGRRGGEGKRGEGEGRRGGREKGGRGEGGGEEREGKKEERGGKGRREAHAHTCVEDICDF